MSQENNELEPKWYVVHTYSGYENKVKTDLEKTVKNRELEDYFFEIVVPMEEQIEIKDGKKKVNLKKVFPGYVLLKMIMDDDTWYVVRNTRGVTGFVGPGSEPVPLTDREVKKLGVERAKTVEVTFAVGDNVKISAGPMEGFTGEVKDINTEDGTADVSVSMFGRETLATLNINQVKAADEY